MPALALALHAVVAAALAAAAPPTAEGAAGPGTTPVPVSAGRWPLDPVPEVVAGFDPPEQRWSAGHRGVDLLATAGAPVRAALAGTVSFAGTIAGRGVVVVEHTDGRRTTYEPVAPSVAVGDHVGSGATLGTVQAGGSHCPPRACLHWGLRVGEEYLDPLTLVRRGPVRLLPVGPP
ncbi:murein DD-endopeptidase MepM/ murein hydrolase activator NlpD [Marmoricola sp. OAE513]|uniref:murein hydrolase activator EnvC family protein n=1 Tax=Marmoricola sp. OAE513 TaxID=2817894 RepID=UPI001AE4A00B